MGVTIKSVWSTCLFLKTKTDLSECKLACSQQMNLWSSGYKHYKDMGGKTNRKQSSKTSCRDHAINQMQMNLSKTQPLAIIDPSYCLATEKKSERHPMFIFVFVFVFTFVPEHEQKHYSPNDWRLCGYSHQPNCRLYSNP